MRYLHLDITSGNALPDRKPGVNDTNRGGHRSGRIWAIYNHPTIATRSHHTHTNENWTKSKYASRKSDKANILE